MESGTLIELRLAYTCRPLSRSKSLEGRLLHIAKLI